MIQQRDGTGKQPTKETFQAHARTLPYDSRVMGLYLLGASQSGKSRMLGRVIAWQDFIAERAQVIFDARGVTIRNFLDKLMRFLQHLPLEQHVKYWRRIRYVDTSGKTGHITPLPLYYRLSPSETLAEISERFLQLTLRSNPHLADAQVFGWPPLHRFGLNAGIICASLGLQITDMDSLITHPEQWLSRFAEAEARYPEARPACDFFRNEYLPMRQAGRSQLTAAFRDKVFHFPLDPYLACQFGAREPGIDWEEIERDGITLLVDFSGETNDDLRRFKLLWLFDYFFSWVKLRGRRTMPLSLLFDEFSAMTSKVFTGENPLATELNEFIQEYLRNSNIWLTVAHQSIQQLDEQMQNSVLSLGNYLFGRVATMPEARILADAFFKREPMRAKHWRKIWWGMTETNSWDRVIASYPAVIDYEPEFMPLEEQLELAAQQLVELPRFRFLCRLAIGDGEVNQAVVPLTIEHVDRDEETGAYQYPDPKTIAEICSLLAAQSGIPVASIRKEPDVALPERQAEPRQRQPVQREPEATKDMTQPAPVGGSAAVLPPPSQPPPQPRHQRRRQIT